MSNQLSRNWIIEQCKEVSFKKGASFVTKNKVKQLELTSEHFLAEVDNERVIISNYQDLKQINCSCTCPKLSSVTFYCQHIAAALIQLQNIYDVTSMRVETKTNNALLKKKEHLDFREVVPLKLQLRWSEGWQEPNLVLYNKEIPLNIDYLATHIDSNKYCIDFNLYEEIENLTNHPFSTKDFFRLIKNLNLSQLMYLIKGKEAQLVTSLHSLIQLEVDYMSDSIFLTTNEIDAHLLIEERALLYRDELILLDEKPFLFIQQLFLLRRLRIDVINWPFIQREIMPKLTNCLSFNLKDSYISWEQRSPLIVHLFLDRFKDQLLVSLDFKYGDFVFNPFTYTAQLPFIRNIAQENMYFNYLESFDLNRVEEGYVLSDEEKEYDFLQYGLRKLPVETKIFATTGVRNRIAPASKFPKIKVKVKKERTNWLQFSFDTEQISKEEILGIMEGLRLNKKYYPLKDGSLLALDLKEKEQIQKFLNGIILDEEFDPHLIEIPIKDSLPFIFGKMFEQTESFKQFVETFYKIPLEVPKLNGIQLKDYQLQGINWMSFLSEHNLGGVLADDMGLGKTIQAIGYIASHQQEKTLIICPTSVVYQWKQELSKLIPHKKVLVLDGDIKLRKQKQNIWTNEIILTSYELLKKDISFYEKIEWETIFLDEAQYFKNPQTILFRSLKKLKANQRFALTGTPIENNLVELWSIYHIVLPELFGKLDKFRFLSKEEIAKRLSVFLLRRKKDEIQLGLPEKHTHIVEVDLSPKEKHYYAAYLAKLKEETFTKLNREVGPQQQKIIFLAALTRLRQICCHLQLIEKSEQDDSSKLKALLRIIQDAKQQNKKVLVFSQFTSMLRIISRSLMTNEISFIYLDGQTKKESRTNLVKQFNEGLTDVFLISLKAGGVGLNLTGANVVIMYDSWWNPMVESQAEDRAYRIGQTEDVHVIKLITKGTIEEKLQQLQEKKKDLVEEIFSTHENPLLENIEEQVKWLIE